ncbi:MarR family winged helix-turn-helix transcriptional regulator [Thermomonas sp.]|uniref:MarR family winged helix-turn-helix transcriptional regulator n=1 Tax=Thermomonas sp. TaxID=1971895 RepID=UPI001DEC925B|nr:MarR family winged helix-turn-helix transcriptional regulator [Thermomonas sp.]MBZ0088607.1 MarR family winged helix-turn-helix transcriptional regulator [Thermomonas sp.]MCO5055159.1 MarR family winged helix-turn-helix transcriptional regulator [Thermomonas sp.]HRO62321.1 MarR family winged helix-turn-helix transcriptional regulator [Thermomonas sp.]
MAASAKRPREACRGADSGAVLVLERFLPYRLSILTNHVSQAIADLYAQRFGIGVTEWRVIAVLGRFPGSSANQVADYTAMDKVAVSRAVARLLERGLITRRRHATDRRRSVLALSAEGRRIHAGIAPLALGIEQRILAALRPRERDLLFRLLDRLDALDLHAEVAGQGV